AIQVCIHQGRRTQASFPRRSEAQSRGRPSPPQQGGITGRRRSAAVGQASSWVREAHPGRPGALVGPFGLPLGGSRAREGAGPGAAPANGSKRSAEVCPARPPPSKPECVPHGFVESGSSSSA
ncbi:hypothetical protein THAOC_32449, partial [Thalassiosira oceanica]